LNPSSQNGNSRVLKPVALKSSSHQIAVEVLTPIFEPEVTAQVVVAAGLADRPRREYWVGMPTVAAILGQKIIPGLLDRYLGKTGYKSQQIESEKQDPNAPNNLYNYVPGTWSARGKFADSSARSSAEVFVSLHLHWFALGLAALIAGGLVLRNVRD
jgi:hypothetical protein